MKTIIDNGLKGEFHSKFQKDTSNILKLFNNPLWEDSISFFVERERNSWIEERGRMVKLLFEKGVKSW